MLPSTYTILLGRAKRRNLRLGEWFDEMAMAERIFKGLNGEDPDVADVGQCFGRAIHDAIERLDEAKELFDIFPASAGDHGALLRELKNVYDDLVVFLRHEGYWAKASDGPRGACKKQRSSKSRRPS